VTKTHCVRGHELAGDNLVIVSKGRDSNKTARTCRQCREIHRQQHRAILNPLSPREMREKAVLEQRVEQLFTELQRLVDREVLRGDLGERVARLALERLIDEGYVVTEPAE
jgi:hypothetical protein